MGLVLSEISFYLDYHTFVIFNPGPAEPGYAMLVQTVYPDQLA